MPHYFFDTDDGDLQAEDDDGLDLSDDEAARRAAISALPDMAHDRLPDGDHRNFTVRVRDQNGTVIYSARLVLDGGWHVPRRA